MKHVLMVQEESDDVRFKMWSKESEDDEVGKPTHGGSFVVHSKK